MTTPHDPSTPAVENIVRPAIYAKQQFSVRTLRLRTGSRAMYWTGLALWLVYLILAAQDELTRFVTAFAALLPFIGSVLVLGGILFGLAASYTYDEPVEQRQP